MISQPEPNQHQQILPFRALDDTGPDPDETLTLRHYYSEWVLPELSHAAPRSLVEDSTALKHWEHYTHDPDIRGLTRQDLELLRDGMLQDEYAAATINKTWRELKMMMEFAHDERVISVVPKIGYRMKSMLLKEHPKIQRETISDFEVEQLWRSCQAATYPRDRVTPAPKSWRVALYLFWLYGARTWDVFSLEWKNVKFRDRLIQFEAMKTRKLQGLPLTDLGIRHLRSISNHSHRVFPGFNSRGCFLKRTGKWKTGYYTTWRNEIFRTSEIETYIVLKNFRETMLTRFNGNADEPGLGNWIAGHYVPGVSAQCYDLPTKRIRKAIESVTVPACFEEIQH